MKKVYNAGKGRSKEEDCGGMSSGFPGRKGCIPEGKETAKHGKSDQKEELKQFLPSNSQSIFMVMQIFALLRQYFCLQVRNNKRNCSKVITCILLGPLGLTRATSSKTDVFNYCGNQCTYGRPKRPNWGQIILMKIYLYSR